jgi:hypothetical protein
MTIIPSDNPSLLNFARLLRSTAKNCRLRPAKIIKAYQLHHEISDYALFHLVRNEPFPLYRLGGRHVS